MDESIYEVTRNEYTGFINQINPDCRLVETETENGVTHSRILSKTSGVVFCERVTSETEEKYYVYEMPRDEERIAAKPILHLELQTPEEVKAFVDILAKIRKDND